MDQYVKLADIYDYLVQGVDYDDWFNYIREIAGRFNVKLTSVLDLACGTGNTTLPFARHSIKVYGLDLSGAMLDKAREKAAAENLTVEFLQQDMRELRLPEKVDLVTCYHDGLNYITAYTDMVKVFHGVYSALRPGGLFIFDMNAVAKLAKGASNDTTFLDEEDMSLIWETDYNPVEDLWEIRLTGFIKKGALYEKFYEVHQEKYYSRDEIIAALGRTGFELLAEYHGFTFDPPNPSTRRVFYVARKPNG